MIRIYNFPDKLKAIIRKSAVAAIESQKYRSGLADINFIMVSDNEIKKLNIKYRKVRRITDVISFRYSKDPIKGDIFISKGRSLKQANSQGHPWEKEISYLVIHGVLHLFGYTDYVPDARKKMFKIQDKAWQCLFS